MIAQNDLPYVSFILFSQVLSSLVHFQIRLQWQLLWPCLDVTYANRLSSICSFSAKRQSTLLIHSCCSHCPSLMSEHLCAPDCIVFLICPARAELEIQYCCSTCCSPRLVVSLKQSKPIVLAVSKWVQCGLYLILYVSILVLITVAGGKILSPCGASWG